MEILVRMMSTCLPAGPLENDREIKVAGCSIDDLSNTVDAAGFESDVFDASIAESFDNLCGFLSTWNSCYDTEPFDQ